MSTVDKKGNKHYILGTYSYMYMHISFIPWLSFEVCLHWDIHKYCA